MADKRTVFNITANTWVRVVNGETAAKIHKSIQDVTYNSMVFTLTGDTPTGLPSANPTAEKMGFDQFNNHFLSDSAAVYMWVRCNPGETGRLIVTL